MVPVAIDERNMVRPLHYALEDEHEETPMCRSHGIVIMTRDPTMVTCRSCQSAMMRSV